MKKRKRRGRGANKSSQSTLSDLQPKEKSVPASSPPDGPLIDAPSYRSFLVRLWQERGESEGCWRGEVESIQSGVLIEVASLAEVFNLIGQAVVGARSKDDSRI